MIDKVKFYKKVREVGLLKSLTNDQVQSIDTVLNYWDNSFILCRLALRFFSFIDK